MADRSGFREGESKEMLLKNIEEKLKSDETLKKLNNKRREEYLNQATTDEGSIIEDIFKQEEMNSELKKILNNRKGSFDKKESNRKNPKKNKKKVKKSKLERFPSIFKIDLKEKDGKKIKKIPLGDKRIIKFETDVQDDYLYRPEDKGSLELKILDYKRNSLNKNNSDSKPNEVTDAFEVDNTLSDHNIKIVFKPKPDVVQVGDEIKINAKLTSPNGDLEVPFYIGIDSERKNSINEPNKPQIDKYGNLPKLIKVKKKDEVWVLERGNEWKEKPQGWDENNIIKITEHEDKIDTVTINMGSHVLNQYCSKKAHNAKKIESCKKKYSISVYVHAILLFNSIEQVKNIDRSEFVAETFKSYVKFLFFDTNNIHQG